MNEETVSLMVERDIPLIPTIFPLINIERHRIEGSVPEFAVKKAQQVKPFFMESLRMVREAGVKIALGTDTGCPFSFHGSNLNEVVFLVENGFSPMEAMGACTQTAAKTLGLQEDLGTIEEGKLADLIVVQGNPLDDITSLTRDQNIRIVMKDGQFIKDGFQN